MKVKNQLALIYLYTTYSISKKTVKVRTKEITTMTLGGFPSPSPLPLGSSFSCGASFHLAGVV